jgi:hypothetical protein
MFMWGINIIYFSKLPLSVKKVKIKILIIIAKLRNQTLAMQLSYPMI